MPDSSKPREPWIVRSGRWLTKRRGIIFTPFFAVALLSSRFAVRPWIELGQDLLGVLCLVAGTRLRLIAASYHEGSHSAQPITAGPYAWVRHPLYLANFLLGLGIVLFTGWWPIWVSYAIFFLPVHILIARSEEVHLTHLYGDQYEAYRRAVPAILPWRAFSGPRHGTPNNFKLKKGKEGLKALGYAAGAAAVLVFKEWRQVVRLPEAKPLPGFVNAVLLLIAALAVIYRPKIRWGWLRGLQTAIAAACMLLLASHLPGVWVVSHTR